MNEPQEASTSSTPFSMDILSPAEHLARTTKKNYPKNDIYRGRTRVLKSKLKEIRIGLGLCLTDVSAAVDISYQSIRPWEEGANLSLHSALKLAKFYGKSVEELWALKEES